MGEVYMPPSPEQGELQRFTSDAKRHLALLQESENTPTPVRDAAGELRKEIESLPSRSGYEFWECHEWYCLKYYLGLPWFVVLMLSFELARPINRVGDSFLGILLVTFWIVCFIAIFATYPLIFRYFKPDVYLNEKGGMLYLSRYRSNILSGRIQHLAKSIYDEKKEYKQPIFQCLSDYDTCRGGKNPRSLICILLCSICIASNAIKLFQK